MKNCFLLAALVYSVGGICNLRSRVPYNLQPLDTVKIYNVYCSFTDGNSVTAWGGNYSSFYPAEECPKKDKDKYVENFKSITHHFSSQKFFWMKLYNTNDRLIYESLKYGDCRVGKFICYWPNGKRKMTGQYDGAYVKKKTGEYILKKCAGQQSGTWCYYDEDGKFLRYEEY